VQRKFTIRVSLTFGPQSSCDFFSLSLPLSRLFMFWISIFSTQCENLIFYEKKSKWFADGLKIILYLLNKKFMQCFKIRAIKFDMTVFCALNCATFQPSCKHDWNLTVETKLVRLKKFKKSIKISSRKSYSRICKNNSHLNHLITYSQKTDLSLLKRHITTLPIIEEE
jgi:hypothetical protein